MVDGDLLDDGAAQREADERDRRLADRLDQLGRVTREGLEWPGQRDLALRGPDAAVVERGAAELGLEERDLVRVPVRRQAAASGHPDDVWAGAVLDVVDAGLRGVKPHGR